MQMVRGEKGGRRELLGKEEEESLCRRTFLQYIHEHSVDSKDMGEYANSFPLPFFLMHPSFPSSIPVEETVQKKYPPNNALKGGSGKQAKNFFGFALQLCV